MDPEVLKKLLEMKVGVPNNPMMLVQYTDKSFLFFEHEACLNRQKGESVDKNKHINIANSTSTGLRSSVPVQLLPSNRVDISTLAKNTDKVLEGKYFLCRTIAPPFKMTSIMTIVEDPTGQQGIRIALYNYSRGTRIDYEGLLEDLPVGQILAVKNPWFKSTQDGGFSLRCDNPGDVVFISELLSREIFPGIKWGSEIPRKWRNLIKSQPNTQMEWKNEGNKLFVAQKYQKAIQCYTEGLNLKDGTADVQVTCDMLSNRAAGYLKLDCFQSALEDLDKLLKINPNNVKGLYRRGNCLLGLQRFEEAISFLKKSKIDSKNKKMFTDLLKLAEILLKQKKTGEYDILKLWKAGSDARHDDCTDFIGPVKVQNVDGKGRGLVATQEIQPGQLISATKAFALILREEQEVQVEVEMNINLETNYVNTASQRKLVQNIAQKLTMEPKLCREVYKLYAGPNLSIYEENGEEGEHVDIKRIDQICTFNEFGGSLSNEASRGESLMEDNLLGRTSTGLWIFPSFINHSCWDANAVWKTFGDMLFVRAFKKIAQGEEILIPYLSPSQNYEEREKFMKKHGFVCKCQLCAIDRVDSAGGRKRAELLKKIDKLDKNQNGYHEMLSCFQEMWYLSTKKPKLNIIPSLAVPLEKLAKYFFRKLEYRKAANLLIKCFDMTRNSPLKEIAVGSCVNLIAAYLMEGNVKEGKKWTDTLRKELLIFFGSLDMAKVITGDTLLLMEQFNLTL